jgi:hypothetical protein
MIENHMFSWLHRERVSIEVLGPKGNKKSNKEHFKEKQWFNNIRVKQVFKVKSTLNSSLKQTRITNSTRNKYIRVES